MHMFIKIILFLLELFEFMYLEINIDKTNYDY